VRALHRRCLNDFIFAVSESTIWQYNPRDGSWLSDLDACIKPARGPELQDTATLCILGGADQNGN
jgi:hypothetical protein